jgi:hypothetical protein
LYVFALQFQLISLFLAAVSQPIIHLYRFRRAIPKPKEGFRETRFIQGADISMSHNAKKELLRQLAQEAGLTEQELLDEFGESPQAVFSKSTDTMERQIREFFGLRIKADAREQ